MAAGYEVFSDESGNIYLKAPDKLVVVPQHNAIPVYVPSHNGLLRLFEVNGVWGRLGCFLPQNGLHCSRHRQ